MSGHEPTLARQDDATAGSGPDGSMSADSGQERRPDYLEGFLAAGRRTGLPGEAPKAAAVAEDHPTDESVRDDVVAALREIYDPEIPVNIYDLGLIYGIEVDGGHVVVTMTLTTPHCPVAESMPGEVEMRVGAVEAVGSAEVNLVWDPPWDPQKMSDDAKLELGML
jgi:FeS assembly SUF system protein